MSATLTDAELDAMEASLDPVAERIFPHANARRLITELRMVRAMLLDTMELHETEERRAVISVLRRMNLHDLADSIARGEHR